MDACYSVDGPAPTVVGRYEHAWVSPLNLDVPQTFPSNHRLPTDRFQAVLQVGSVVPPLVAHILLTVFKCAQRQHAPASVRGGAGVM